MIAAPLAIATATTFTALAVSEINELTHIPLGAVAASFVFVLTLTAWLSRKLQKIEDDLEGLKRELASRPCQKSPDNCPR